ncbi:hypothetical protein AgCh_004650 [Apium graveolens]
MNTQKISSIKIPPFDKANYTLWKKKMLLFIRMTNHLYIGILKNGPFTAVVRVEETTDGDMVIPAHYAPKDPFEYTEPEREKVSLDSALQLILIESLDNVMYNNIVNCDTAKQIWEKIEILYEGTEEVRSNQRRILISQYEGFMAKPKEAISTSEKRVNDTEEQVILELDEEDEFYTFDELDELDKSMAYLARKFSNIRVKKPRYFKNKGQFFNKDNSWKRKGKKPKKAKKNKAYLKLEAKYDALLKKQQGKAYIAEGKCWDDSDNDEDEEVGNYTLLALEKGDSSSSKSQVPTLTTIDLNVSQYKETVEKMSTEMFHIHTSMVAANEEVSRLKKINEKLESEKQEVELLLVELDAAK